MNMNWQDEEPTFEQVYPKAEFSELIRMCLALTDAVISSSARLKLRYERPDSTSHGLEVTSECPTLGSDPSIS